MVTRFSSLLVAALLSLAGTHSFAATPPATQQPEKAPIEIPAPQKGPQPQYSRSYYYNFGSWRVGYTASQDFSFTSYGGTTHIYSIYTYGSAYNSIDNCPSRLYAGDSCTIRVYFRPWYAGYQDGQTMISTDNGTTTVFLSGYGY